MKRDRNLDDSLKEFLFVGGSAAPNVFKNFVGFEELAMVKQVDAAL